nr:hypothetical protein [Tanacetum cinerariifolium]
MGKTDEPPIVKADPKDWFKKPKRPLTLNLEWNTDKTVDDGPTQNCLSDLAKAKKPSKTFNELMSTPIDFTTLAMNGLQIKDLTKADSVGSVYNLLKGTCKRGSTDRTYTSSLTKTKDAKYDLQGIEDMVPTLWSPIKVVYDKHVALVTNVKVNKWYGYGHLEEIEVRRAYQQLYKFMDGDFPRLHLNEIEDMLLLVVQNKLFNLKSNAIFDLVVALRMFTRRIVIQKRVEDLQLGDTLHDMATNLRMRYNKAMPKRRWRNLDRSQSHIMVKDIDQQLLERRLMRSLEKFVGGREYGEDLRQLQRTI